MSRPNVWDLDGSGADDGDVPTWDAALGRYVPAPPAGGVPTGAAGGVLSGTYPNPGFAADMATQAELDALSAGGSGGSSTFQTLTYSTALTPDPTAGEVIYITLTGPTTITAPTATEGLRMTLVLIQDSTGSRVVRFGSGFRMDRSYVRGLPSRRDVLEFYCDGTRWVQVGAYNLMTPASEFDSFTKADSSSSLGSTEQGTAWTSAVGTWGIATNQAKNFASGGNAVLDLGGADMEVAAKITRQNDEGVCARYVDSSNFYSFDVQAAAPRLLKKVAGSFTTLKQAGTFVSGSELCLRVQGSVLTCLIDGNILYTVFDASLSAGTKGGLWQGTAGITGRWDDFRLSAI